ncbi:hypothetical protein M8C21_001732 [Ambrosia artemisiifolia]|uniref:GRPD C-terminal domain-containing protein n=1 Tax=Ambrosia artemisiifolia TaxID=4212 RepID=A0AAD5GBU1_AMBAR|nr:hypothetical protein M8C21_001732 [Ambrosia artemisiifolia]
MDMEQESEWNAAQNISISENLLAAAKRQLHFLEVVDRNRWLYQGPTLQWAIYRYNACWLPLLAKHSESPITEGPLVVPLDCEWVWHCHRLNPVRYKSDCEEFYGKVLDNCNVASSVQGLSKRETEEIWNKLYPDEPYDLDMTRALTTEFSEAMYKTQSFSKYDFALAIERQSPFYYQVSRPHVKSDLFLEAAVARYKGFLHLIRRNRERSIKQFCVPTYDVDLIWHTHQLHPASYCKDLTELIGKVLEHDDTDQNRAKDKSSTKEILGLTKAGETLVVAQYIGQEWSLLDSLWSLKPENSNNKDSALLLTGPHMVKLVTGRKLDYEPKHVHKQTNERNFMTAIEFSVDHPYGKAVALIDLKTGLLTLQEDWFALAGIVSAFIASKHLNKGRIK